MTGEATSGPCCWICKDLWDLDPPNLTPLLISLFNSAPQYKSVYFSFSPFYYSFLFLFIIIISTRPRFSFLRHHVNKTPPLLHFPILISHSQELCVCVCFLFHTLTKREKNAFESSLTHKQSKGCVIVWWMPPAKFSGRIWRKCWSNRLLVLTNFTF